jgi:hypothetical protein
VHLPKLLMMAQSRRSPLLYQYLWEINAGFCQVRNAMDELQRTAGFNRGELSRFSMLIAETRADTLSYLLETLADLETQQAGRLFSSRQARERRESPK